jgi:RimJ/RimL family protein N-acetyltransferase
VTLTPTNAALRPDYPVLTARLVLRPFEAGDLDDLYDIYRRPEVVRYLYWDVRSREEAEEDLQRRISQSRLDEDCRRLALAVVLPRPGRVIGDVTLKWSSREHRQGEVGFSFHPGHRGRGYATEASAALLELGFDGLGLHRIIGRCDARNEASARVLQRLGMRQEAHFVHDEVFKGEWGDQLVYAILEDEWRVRRPKASGEKRLSSS